MNYKCFICGYTADKPGDCPMCHLPLDEQENAGGKPAEDNQQKKEGGESTETKPTNPTTYQT